MQSLILVILAAVVVTLALPPLRRNLVSRHVLKWFRSVLPPMSSTEKAAIDAGTTWWDPEVFSGSPDWQALLRIEPSTLSDEEQAFLDGPVEKPVVRDGNIEAAPVLEVTLSFDHRVIDGGLAQRFMARIRENLEEPVKALL